MADYALTPLMLEFTQATLQANPELVDLVEITPGNNKIYWDRAPDGIEMPYITIHHLKGGWENETQRQTADYTLKVMGHAADAVTAAALIKQIECGLTDVDLIDSLGNVVGYTPVEHILPFSDSYQVQNFVYWKVGGIFRFRFATC